MYPEPLHTIAVQYLAETVKTDMLKKLSGGKLNYYTNPRNKLTKILKNINA